MALLPEGGATRGGSEVGVEVGGTCQPQAANPIEFIKGIHWHPLMGTYIKRVTHITLSEGASGSQKRNPTSHGPEGSDPQAGDVWSKDRRPPGAATAVLAQPLDKASQVHHHLGKSMGNEGCIVSGY